MQIASFLPHYQLVCISFDISSFSLISYFAKEPVLRCNIGAFAVQNRHFYNVKQWVLQHVGNKVVIWFMYFEKIFTLLLRFRSISHNV